jgi:hypothetical protein
LLQLPPQPSSSPQALPVQSGLHTQAASRQYLSGMQLPLLHWPPQPLSLPHCLLSQSGTQPGRPLDLRH